MIQKVGMNWNIPYDNVPEPIVYVDRMPEWDEFIFQARRIPGHHGTFFFASREDGHARYYYHDPANQRGFGGQEFLLNVGDLRHVRVVGPWSSNPAAMVTAGFPCVDDVTVICEGDHFAGSWLVSVLRPWLEEIGVSLDWIAANPYDRHNSLMRLDRTQVLVVGQHARAHPVLDENNAVARWRPRAWTYQEFEYRRRLLRMAVDYSTLHQLTLSHLRSVPETFLVEHQKWERNHNRIKDPNEERVDYEQHYRDVRTRLRRLLVERGVLR